MPIAKSDLNTLWYWKFGISGTVAASLHTKIRLPASVIAL